MYFENIIFTIIELKKYESKYDNKRNCKCNYLLNKLMNNLSFSKGGGPQTPY